MSRAMRVLPLAGTKAGCAFSELRRLAKQQGWRVEPTKGSHWRFIPPDPTQRQVITAGTPSDRRALRNIAADLKRSGLRTNCR